VRRRLRNEKREGKTGRQNRMSEEAYGIRRERDKGI